jgi:cell division protein FtsW
LNDNAVQILFVGLFLLIFGLFAIYSVSIFESFDLTLDFVEQGLREEPSNYYYFFEQSVKLAVGLVLALIAWLTPMHIIRRWKYIIFAGSLVLLLLLFTPLGITLN